MKRAFTLIELLVVIAIIAILAAILFPVFAQAKTAAKKTSALSAIKQQSTGTAVYLSDSDDTFPTGWGRTDAGGMNSLAVQYVPQDWMVGRTGENVLNTQISKGDVLNITFPYTKNWDLLHPPGMSTTVAFIPAAALNGPNRAVNNGFAYNGLLHSWNASAVAAPSQLPLYTQTEGNLSLRGVDTGPNPVIYCGGTNQPCLYTPVSSTSCGGFGNGTYDYYIYPNATQWIYGQTQVWSYADTSAKSKRLAANVNGRTDFRQDPYTNYTPRGVDRSTGWYDEFYCHALLFRPDFDFTNFPTNPRQGY